MAINVNTNINVHEVEDLCSQLEGEIQELHVMVDAESYAEALTQIAMLEVRLDDLRKQLKGSDDNG